MGRGVTEAQWLAARAMSEGAVPTRVRVAAALGIDPTYVYARSAKENWAVLDGRNTEIQALYREAQAIAAALSGRELAEPDDDDGETVLPEAPVQTAQPVVAQDGGTETGAAADAGTALAGTALAGPDSAGAGVAAQPPAGAPVLAVPEWDQLDPVELLANAGAFVARQIGRLIATADRRGGRLDKAQIDGLAALAKMMDRWETLARERAVDDRIRTDGELADTLGRITQKIVALADEEARRLVEEERAAGAV